MEKLYNNLKNVEDEIVNIAVNKLNKFNDRYCFFLENEELCDSSEETDNKEGFCNIKEHMLINYSFNDEIIHTYQSIKNFYSPFDIDMLNLILKCIQIKTNICLQNYKNQNKILNEQDQIKFLVENPIRTPEYYINLLKYTDKTIKDILVNIFELINVYYTKNIIVVIKRQIF